MVGGGVIGLATAVFCRRAGISRVLLIEAARLAGAASGGAGGALAPALHQLSNPPAFVALARTSLALYRQLDQDGVGCAPLAARPRAARTTAPPPDVAGERVRM